MCSRWHVNVQSTVCEFLYKTEFLQEALTASCLPASWPSIAIKLWYSQVKETHHRLVSSTREPVIEHALDLKFRLLLAVICTVNRVQMFWSTAAGLISERKSLM